MKVAKTETRRFVAVAGLVLAAAVLSAGCAARWTYRQGRAAAQRGDWDEAVARLTKATTKSPNNVRYRLELDNARAQAGHAHAVRARELAGGGDLERAADEMEVATKFDPGNQAIADELRNLRGAIRAREEEKRAVAEEQAAAARRRASRYPVPELSPRSSKPITLNFKDASLQKVLETLGKLGGVNILLDPDFKDKQVTVPLANVTFQEALDQITLVNKLFYKVVDQNTLLVLMDNAAKRKAYDDIVVRTFYMSNVNDDKEFDKMVQAVNKLAGITKSYTDKTLGAITLVGTPDKLALAEKVLDAYDKSRGEVIIDVQILEVNRSKLKDYGIELSSYAASASFDPISDGGSAVTTTLRAHLLSSLNLSDFVVSIPRSLLARMTQTETMARLLASPRLRAAEGEKATLNIGTKVPVPQTSYLSYGIGGGSGGTNQGGLSPYTPMTQFTYVDVGVKVELTPRISSGDEVSLKIKAELSSLGAAVPMGQGLEINEILTRSIEGSIRVKDGEASLLGGLLQTDDSSSLSGATGLQSIPILNRLLGGQSRSKRETEILISLTPHIIRAPRITDDDRKALHVGTEDVIRVKGARPALFGAPDDADITGAPAAAPTRPAVPPASVVPAGATAAPVTPVATAVPQAPTPPAPVAIAPPPLPTAASATPAGTMPDGLFSPAQLAVGLNDVATVSLVVRRARALAVVEIDLEYDGGAVEVTGLAPGALLPLGGRTPTTAVTQPAPGRVHARLALPADARAAGSGAVLTFSVRGLRPGGTAVRVAALRLSGPDGADAVTAAVEALPVTVTGPREGTR